MLDLAELAEEGADLLGFGAGSESSNEESTGLKLGSLSGSVGCALIATRTTVSASAAAAGGG
jgi:hypothetical protein